MTVSIDPEALAASLRKLQARRQDIPLSDLLLSVVDACTDLFAIDGSGLMLADEHGNLRHVVASDEVSRLLETAQIEVGAGPCVDTYVTGLRTETQDVQTDERWPALSPELAATEIRVVLGVPIRLAGMPLGSLDVYRNLDRPFDDSERQALERYAEVVSAMLSKSLQADHADELVEQLSYALDNRVPIERGIGFLMARDGLTAEEAFGRLRSVARSSRRKVGAVAADLLDTGHLPGDPSH